MKNKTYDFSNLIIPILLAVCSIFAPRVTELNLPSFVIFCIAPVVIIFSAVRLVYMSYQYRFKEERHYFILGWYASALAVFYMLLHNYRAIPFRTRMITMYRSYAPDDPPDTIGTDFNIYLLEDGAYILFGLSCIYLLLYLWRKKESDNLRYAIQAFYLTFVLANYIYLGHAGFNDRVYWGRY